MKLTPADINNAFGNPDLYLFDHILKGTFNKGKVLTDFGCGEGRNIKYFVASGYAVYGVDIYEKAIQIAQMVYRDSAFFKLSSIESKPFPDKSSHISLCINVLHHATDVNHFREILSAIVDMTTVDGIVFVRTLITPKAENEKTAEHFIIGEANFKEMIQSFNLSWIEPLKKEVDDTGRSLCVAVLRRC